LFSERETEQNDTTPRNIIFLGKALPTKCGILTAQKQLSVLVLGVVREDIHSRALAEICRGFLLKKFR
jgi:hypothetical protein